jgi:hypothetical protein
MGHGKRRSIPLGRREARQVPQGTALDVAVDIVVSFDGDGDVDWDVTL